MISQPLSHKRKTSVQRRGKTENRRHHYYLTVEFLELRNEIPARDSILPGRSLYVNEIEWQCVHEGYIQTKYSKKNRYSKAVYFVQSFYSNLTTSVQSYDYQYT